MKRTTFKVPIYDWTVTIATVYNKDCADDMRSLIEEFDLPNGEDLVEFVNDESFNGGRTYTKGNTREMLVILFPWKSEEDFIRVLNHEKRHMIDNIAEWHELTCSESVAYLDGFISQEIYKRLNEIR